jgi:hypothetical protein
MKPDKQIPRDESKSGHSGRSLDLFYFQQRGDNRYYLRITPLGVFLILLLTMLSLGMIFYFAITQIQQPNVNANITVRSPTLYSPNKVIIQQPPPPLMPKPSRGISQPLLSPTPPKIEGLLNSNIVNSAKRPENGRNSNEQ